MFQSFLYEQSSCLMQELLISGRALLRKFVRERAEFKKILNEIRKTQFLTKEEIDRLHSKKLSIMLQHALKNVPYYVKRYSEYGVFNNSIEGAHQIKRAPILTREDILTNKNQVRANNTGRIYYKGGTSGTTGTPLTIYHDIHSIIHENAHIWRQLQWAGFRLGMKRAWIRGDMIIPVKVTESPFWRMNSAENMLMFSSYHLSYRNAPFYLKALERFNPDIIQAYPSSISFLSSYLSDIGKFFKGTKLKGIVTSSETLKNEQRKIVEKRFGCTVFDWTASMRGWLQ